jgi:threonine dehydrogenase-like Zn-dependent dehydrogenase
MYLAEAALAEPASCAAHAVSKAEVKRGDSVVIVGAGAIGALASQIARLHSPANLVMVEIDSGKLEACKKLGATHTINGKTENVSQAVMEITQGLGADAIIECSGSLEPIQGAFTYVGTKGRIVVNGMPPERKFEIDFVALQLRDAVFRPSNGYTTSIWLRTLQLLCNHAIDAGTIITHRLPLASIDEAFTILRERRDGATKVTTSPRWS